MNSSVFIVIFNNEYSFIVWLLAFMFIFYYYTSQLANSPILPFIQQLTPTLFNFMEINKLSSSNKLTKLLILASYPTVFLKIDKK